MDNAIITRVTNIIIGRWKGGRCLCDAAPLLEENLAWIFARSWCPIVLCPCHHSSASHAPLTHWLLLHSRSLILFQWRPRKFARTQSKITRSSGSIVICLGYWYIQNILRTLKVWGQRRHSNCRKSQNSRCLMKRHVKSRRPAQQWSWLSGSGRSNFVTKCHSSYQSFYHLWNISAHMFIPCLKICRDIKILLFLVSVEFSIHRTLFVHCHCAQHLLTSAFLG